VHPLHVDLFNEFSGADAVSSSLKLGLLARESYKLSQLGRKNVEIEKFGANFSKSGDEVFRYCGISLVVKELPCQGLTSQEGALIIRCERQNNVVEISLAVGQNVHIWKETRRCLVCLTNANHQQSDSSS